MADVEASITSRTKRPPLKALVPPKIVITNEKGEDVDASLSDTPIFWEAKSHKSADFISSYRELYRDVTVSTQTEDLDAFSVSRKRGCCYRFWRCIYVHGSIIGPAPCSFLWLCAHCENFKQKHRCENAPLRRSSFSTKLMYIVFLAFVMMLSSFFIIAYPENIKVQIAEAILQFSPCKSESDGYHRIKGWWGDCKGHAGYFIVYRIFLAWIILLLALILCTIGVMSSKEACRPAVHQGFWLPKFLVFFGLCAATNLFISVRGPFDETFMFVGLAATVIFSIPQLVSFLDMCDILVAYIKQHPIRKNSWQFGYWILTGIVYAFTISVWIALCIFYTHRSSGNELGEALDYGKGSYCLTNIALVLYSVLVGIVTTLSMLFHMFVIKSKKYPHVGVMHASMVFAHTVLYVYMSLGNTEDLECRVVWYPYNYNMASLDVTFSLEGLIHVLNVWFTLIYLTLFEGPRSNAPLSRLINCLCCKIQEPHKSLSHLELAEGPSARLLTLEERKSFLLHNDEGNELQYNWALFHLFLILGSLSMMMGMTNFFRPNAAGPNASNYPAFLCKVSMSPMAVLAFLAPLIVSWVIDREVTSGDEEALESPPVNIEEDGPRSPSQDLTADDADPLGNQGPNDLTG